MSIYKGTELLAGVATNTISNAHSLFDFMWSDHIKNEMSWLRADTFSWQSGAVYIAAYNHLVADYNGGTSQTETVGSYTITYVLATDGHKITTDETTVANIYNESGVAWYYILDTTNQRFKLPRENPNKERIIDTYPVIGNGTAMAVDGPYGPSNPSGAWRSLYVPSSSAAMLGVPPLTQINGFNLPEDPAHTTTFATTNGAVSIYKGKQYLYFYVGQFSQSATEQTAGLNSSLFNGKADVDLSNAAPNASTSAKQTIVGWGIPDYSSGVSISSGYTATEKCWLLTMNNAGGGNNQNGYADTYVNQVQIAHTYVSNWSYNTLDSNLVPLDVGDVVTTDIVRGSVTLTIFPMKGL